ncbi:MAG TPA: hypothetical protein EYP21_03680 [Syntrophaceae bacterium]|nr:hypothetical protein [Syntrophaceae bacterium]
MTTNPIICMLLTLPSTEGRECFMLPCGPEGYEGFTNPKLAFGWNFICLLRLYYLSRYIQYLTMLKHSFDGYKFLEETRSAKDMPR